ncbi:DUF308 domain-containing protein [Candidatus Saccharibacteria bacterium]|nr:DUF308 domain-containing protein [Candidatus Saccharibacteria bacterium]
MAKAKIIKQPIDRVGGNLKKSAWSAAVESLALLIIGLLFVIWPDTMVKILSYIIGIFFIVKGAYNIILYYMEKGQQDFFNNNLLSGIVAILIGVVALAIGENIANIFRIIIGVIVIYESLVRINVASKLSSIGVDSWRYVLILALIMLALGIFITFNTGAVVALVGWLMILTGIIGLVGDFVFIQHVNTVIDKLSGNNHKK